MYRKLGLIGVSLWLDIFFCLRGICLCEPAADNWQAEPNSASLNLLTKLVSRLRKTEIRLYVRVAANLIFIPECHSEVPQHHCQARQYFCSNYGDVPLLLFCRLLFGTTHPTLSWLWLFVGLVFACKYYAVSALKNKKNKCTE